MKMVERNRRNVVSTVND